MQNSTEGSTARINVFADAITRRIERVEIQQENKVKKHCGYQPYTVYSFPLLLAQYTHHMNDKSHQNAKQQELESKLQLLWMP